MSTKPLSTQRDHEQKKYGNRQSNSNLKKRNACSGLTKPPIAKLKECSAYWISSGNCSSSGLMSGPVYDNWLSRLEDWRLVKIKKLRRFRSGVVSLGVLTTVFAAMRERQSKIAASCAKKDVQIYFTHTCIHVPGVLEIGRLAIAQAAACVRSQVPL
jgi:hypothetical protein